MEPTAQVPPAALVARRNGAAIDRARPRAIGALCVALALAAGCTQSANRSLQGYIEGEYVRIAAPFAGTLTQLAVARGEQITAGTRVFALEQQNEVAARRQAEEQLHAAEARVANLKTGKRPDEVNTVAEQLRQAMASRDLAAANLQRQQKLHASGFISSAAMDDARTQLKQQDAFVAQLRSSVATAKLPARDEEIRAAEADARAARDALAQADWRLSQRAISSPAAGLVHDTYYVVGDWVPAGGAVASVLPPENIKVRFYAPETLLGGLARGQQLTLHCDGCPAPIAATITFIADRAEFTPPVLYSKDNRSKLVYLVEAKPAPADAVKLHPGQPVDVTLPP